ncbi:hypothetical protein B9Z55_016659 [Caenorhabditis nigoni]|uniref:F-box domain-containing protein n=1 Tax=Caenorhabditis nigoni TaxID=1611254 RepID=A0A2G5T626_9PELO|nr:hypothetical protein B9Z55_016659 [Caenorhabditis nigoni]
MPINLLKLPLLVGAMVVSELDYKEVFLLSINSRRAYYLVKTARVTVSKITFRFEECCGFNTFAIAVLINKKWFPVTSLLHVYKLALDDVMTVNLGLGYEVYTNFDWWREDNGVFNHRIECVNEPMAIQKAFQDHINSIFHCSENNKLSLSTKWKGSLPNITNVKEVEIEDYYVDSPILTRILTKYPDPHTLSVESNIVGEIPKDSPFFQVENIAIQSRCGPDYFPNFVGRNMCLRRAILTEQDLIQFLQKWISNEAYHNLETFSINMDPLHILNQDLIRQAIEFEEYDPEVPEKRPEFLTFDIPMPINLLKLPRLVGLIVVTELEEYQEVFLLSLCSLRTKFLVKKARIKLPNVSYQFRKCRGHNEFMIGFELHPTNFQYGLYKKVWYPVTSLLHVPKLVLNQISALKFGTGYEADTTIYLWYKEDGSFLHRIKYANDPMGIQKALQNHINSIFHYCGTNKLYLSMKCKGTLPNITNVKDIVIEDETVEPEFLTEVLTSYPNHQSLSIKSRIVGELPKESPVFQVQDIANFVGRNMWLRRALLTEQDIIQFLRKWISNEAYHSLETLSIMRNSGKTINEALIRQTIEFEEYDPSEPEKRPDYYDVVTPIRPIVQRHSLRNEKWLELKRITDGKRAFVQFFHIVFHFFVHKDSLDALNDDDVIWEF